MTAPPLSSRSQRDSEVSEVSEGVSEVSEVSGGCWAIASTPICSVWRLHGVRGETQTPSNWHSWTAELVAACASGDLARNCRDGDHRRMPPLERKRLKPAGEDSQWTPDLVRDQSYVDPPRTPEEGYHFAEDMANEAIHTIRELRLHQPGRPFMLAVHPRTRPRDPPVRRATAHECDRARTDGRRSRRRPRGRAVRRRLVAGIHDDRRPDTLHLHRQRHLDHGRLRHPVPGQRRVRAARCGWPLSSGL